MITPTSILDGVRTKAARTRSGVTIKFGACKQTDFPLSLEVNRMEHIYQVQLLKVLADTWLKGPTDPAFATLKAMLGDLTGDPERETISYLAEVTSPETATLALYRHPPGKAGMGNTRIHVVSGPQEMVVQFLNELVTEDWIGWKSGTSRLNARYTLRKDDKAT